MTTKNILALLAVAGFLGACASNVQAPAAKFDKSQVKLLVVCKAEGGGGRLAPTDRVDGGGGRLAPVDLPPTEGESIESAKESDVARMEGGGGKLSPSDGTEISDSNELTDKIVLALSTDKGCDEGYIVEGSGIVMDATSVTVDAENGPKITVPVDKTSGTFSFSFETTALGRVGLTAF